MKPALADIRLEEMGLLLATSHRHIVLDSSNGLILSGEYLQAKSRESNMLFCSEIFDCLQKTDEIITKITAEVSSPFVQLQNWHTEDLKQNVYGNPAWDIGVAITFLNNNSNAERFLHEYLKHGGIQITIIELYIGILYAKLNEAITNGDINKWEQLAQNECLSIVKGRMIAFNEISTEVLSNVGLPGLARV